MEPLLEMLSTTAYVSGEKLCADLGMTRGAVWKRMEKLRAQGYEITSAGKRGYRLEPAPNSLLPGYVRRELSTRWAGRGELCYAEELGSTNARAKELARAGAPHGSLVLCELQTAGRGRLQRAWEAARGESLLQSLVLRPKLPTEQAQLCTLAAAVAIAGAVEDVCPMLHPGIKWPNDIVLGGKKCVGILSELSADIDGVEFVVPGVGVNVNQPTFAGELAEKATSLLLECRREEPSTPPICRRALLLAYLKRMEDAIDALEREGLTGIMPEYLRRSVTLGARVRVSGIGLELIGTAKRIDDTGALIVTDEGGAECRVLSGDVSVRGLMGYV
ncbi:MAG: biotin--[acetyl-CoA-carboxylase] ligase [Clostridia bacterium]